MEYINKFLRKGGNIYKKSEATKEIGPKTSIPIDNNTFTIQESAVADIFQSSTPKKGQDCDTESDTTADYESAGESSPWKEKSTNLSALAESLAGFHLSTPKKVHSKLNHFPYSPISAEDEDEEVISITSNNSHNSPLSLSSKKSPLSFNSSHSSSRLKTEIPRSPTKSDLESFKAIPESQTLCLPNSLNENARNCNEAQVISPVVEFEDAGPACSYHSEIMNSIVMLNGSSISNTSLIEECKHSQMHENFGNRESDFNVNSRQHPEISSGLEEKKYSTSDVNVPSSNEGNHSTNNIVTIFTEGTNPQSTNIPIENTVINSSQSNTAHYQNTVSAINLTTEIILPEVHSFEKYVEDDVLLGSTNVSSSLDGLHNLKEQDDCLKQDSSRTVVFSEVCKNEVAEDLSSINSSKPVIPLSPKNDDIDDTNFERMKNKFPTIPSKNEFSDTCFDADNTHQGFMHNVGGDQVSSIVNNEDCANVNIRVSPSDQTCKIKHDQNETQLNYSTNNSLSNDSHLDSVFSNDLNSNFTIYSTEGSSNSKISQDLNNELTNTLLESCNVEHLNHIIDSSHTLLFSAESKVASSNSDHNISYDMSSSSIVRRMDTDSNSNSDNGSESNKHSINNTPHVVGSIFASFVAEDKNENKVSDELTSNPSQNFVNSSSMEKPIENSLTSSEPCNGQLCPDDNILTTVETNIINNFEKSEKICENNYEVPSSSEDVETCHGTSLKDLNRNSPTLSDSILRIATEKHPVCFEGNSNNAQTFDSSSNLITEDRENVITTADSSEPNATVANCNEDMSIIEMCNLIETTFNNSLNEKNDTEDLGKNSISESKITSPTTESIDAPKNEVSSLIDSSLASIACETKQENISVTTGVQTFTSLEFSSDPSIHNDNCFTQTKHSILGQESPFEICSIPPKNASEESLTQFSPNFQEEKEQSALKKSQENDNKCDGSIEHSPTEELSSSLFNSVMVKNEINSGITNIDTHTFENTFSGNLNPVVNETSNCIVLSAKSTEIKSDIQHLNLNYENNEIPKDCYSFIEGKKIISAYNSPEIPKTPNNSIASPSEDSNKTQSNNFNGEPCQDRELNSEVNIKTDIIQSSQSNILKKNQRNESTEFSNICHFEFVESHLIKNDNSESENKTVNLEKNLQLSQILPICPKNNVNERILEYPSFQEKTEVPLRAEPEEKKYEFSEVSEAKDTPDTNGSPLGNVPVNSTDVCINKQIVSLTQQMSATSAENELENDKLQNKDFDVKQTSLDFKSSSTSSLILNKGSMKTEQESLDRLKSLKISSSFSTDAGNVNEICSTIPVKPADAIKSSALITSYEDLLDICSEQERLLGFDDSIKVEAEKVVKELQSSPVKNSFALPQAPCNLPASSRNTIRTKEQEETKDSFQDAVNYDFEYLLKIKSKPSFRQRARESLFLKFDPLAAVAVTPETSTPIENKMIFPDSSSDVASPRSMNGEDLLISITPNAKTVKEEPSSSPSSNSNITPKTRHRPSSGHVTPTLKNEILSREISKLNDLMIKQELAYQEQIAQCVEEIEELRKRISEFEEQPLDELQESLTAAKARAKSLQEENHKLILEKTELKRVIDEYDETCKFLIKKNDEEKIELEEKIKKISQDRDASNKHLEALEIAFNDIHQKYEKCKQVIELFKINEEEYKKALEDNKKSLEEQQDHFAKLKSQASKKIADANIEIIEMKKVHNVEMAKLEAVNRKNQMQIKTLEETLEQKHREVAELTKICDELIKVSSSSAHY